MVRANTTFFTSDEIEQERVVYNHDDSVIYSSYNIFNIIYIPTYLYIFIIYIIIFYIYRNRVGTLFTLWPWPPEAEAGDTISNMSASFIFMWC